MNIGLILTIQNLGAWLEIPMHIVSFFGTENFYFLILPVLYWCVDAGLGLRVGVILFFGGAVNETLKLAFHGPRPYWVNSQVKALASESSFGIPSGHSQNAVSVWGMLAFHARRIRIWVIVGVLVFLIGFSRLYLGVHFLGDVLSGWLAGAFILFLILRLWDSFGNWIIRKSLAQQVGLVFVVSLTMVFCSVFFVHALRDFSLPAEWMSNAAHASGVLPAPVTMSKVISSAAMLFGLATGAAWIHQVGGFQASGTVEKRILRYLAGLVGIIIFWNGLGEIFPHDETLFSHVLRFLRYTLLGLWISAGAPWLFLRFNLAENTNR